MNNIEYVYSSRARSVRVRISAGGVRVSVPVGVPLSVAERFVMQNAEKIKARQERLRQSGASCPHVRPGLMLQTLTFAVEGVPDEGAKRLQFKFAEGVLRVHYPPHTPPDCLDAAFLRGLDYFLRKEAHRVLPERVAGLAARHGFSYSGLKIQSARKRWGSCSSRKALNLSFCLLLLPAHLVDYVILHELCHTVEMNHGPRFHALLNEVTGGRDKELNAELRKHHIPPKP